MICSDGFADQGGGRGSPMSACMPGQKAARDEMKTLDSAPVSMCTSTSQLYLRCATTMLANVEALL